jgi:hypothetical protein
MEDKFDKAITRLMDATFSLGSELLDKEDLTERENEFLESLDEYCDALDDLEENQSETD